MQNTMTAILPCNDLRKSQAFYARLGFRVLVDHGGYVLFDRRGGGGAAPAAG